jgi:hypothetical protein
VGSKTGLKNVPLKRSPAKSPSKIKPHHGPDYIGNKRRPTVVAKVDEDDEQELMIKSTRSKSLPAAVFPQIQLHNESLNKSRMTKDSANPIPPGNNRIPAGCQLSKELGSPAKKEQQVCLICHLLAECQYAICLLHSNLAS